MGFNLDGASVTPSFCPYCGGPLIASGLIRSLEQIENDVETSWSPTASDHPNQADGNRPIVAVVNLGAAAVHDPQLTVEFVRNPSANSGSPRLAQGRDPRGWDSEAPVEGVLPLDTGSNSLAFCPRIEQAASGLSSTSASGSLVHVSEAESTRLGGYRLIRELGRGGMGIVYEAEDLRTGRRVALKRLNGDVSPDDPAMARFRREGRLASAIEHPRCVFVLAAEEDHGRPYIVMELMPGTTLKDRVEREGPLGPEDAVEAMLDVLEGLRAAHRLGVIHRDVKPSNCFVESNGRVKVGDFGLSVPLNREGRVTRTNAFVGTPLYSSPEQVKREDLDERSDIYSAGATLFFLLTGRAPFEMEDAAAVVARIVSEDAPRLREIRPDLPRGLERIVARCLERTRERRFRDVGELRAHLLRYATARLATAPATPRFLAFLIDLSVPALLGLAFLITLPILSVVHPSMNFLVSRFTMLSDTTLWAGFLGLTAAWLILGESILGTTPGKNCFGIRVVSMNGAGTLPGTQVVTRVILFTVIALSPSLAVVALGGLGGLLDPILMFLALVPPQLLLWSRARRDRTFRGWHEILSGTRTVAPPSPRMTLARLKARISTRRETAPLLHPIPREGLPDQIGPYRIKGALAWSEMRMILLGVDPNLQREVWVVCRRGTESPTTPPARRNLARSIRTRWLTAGVDGQLAWDAYLAPRGTPLNRLIAERTTLTWAEARHLLERLALEYQRASLEDTLPPEVSVNQVWILPDGTVQLVDYALEEGAVVLESPRTRHGPAVPSTHASPNDSAPPLRDHAATDSGILERNETRFLKFLGDVVRLALDGHLPNAAESSAQPLIASPDQGIKAAVPTHAHAMLERLPGAGSGRVAPYQKLNELVADLERTREAPTSSGRLQRGLLAWGFAALKTLLILVILNAWDQLGELGRLGLVLVPILWETWGRGGLLAGFLGARLVRSYNRPLSRRFALVRALAFWMPALFLLGFARVATIGLIDAHLGEFLQTTALLLPWIYAVPALFNPGGLLHDRLLGVQIVPK